MKDEVVLLVKMGKIPNEENITDELFEKYDSLLQMEDKITWEEAENLITIFSDNCYDLNWGLIHAIESLSLNKNDNEIEEYKRLINKCNSEEYRLILLTRLNNWVQDSNT